MLTLGFDTSNYATSLAVFDTDAKEVVCAKKKFLPVKEGQRGLRQSEALFHHTAALPGLLQELAGETPLARVAAISVSEKPRPAEGSYMPCFLAGVNAASAAACVHGVPLVRTTHQQGHVAAALYASGRWQLFGTSALVFHISGGTTDLLLCNGVTVQQTLGTSLDLYAGQAVDRIGVKLGFPFPAGEHLSRLAAECPQQPRVKAVLKGMNCHLSGLENQCSALLDKGYPPAYVAKYCLCTVGETVFRMVEAAYAAGFRLPVVCAGGVMSSQIVRDYVTARLRDVCFVPGQFASDNAIGVAIIAAKEVGAWPM